MEDQENNVLRFDLPKNDRYKALLLDDDPMFCSTLKSYGKKKKIDIITSQSIGYFLSNLGQTTTDRPGQDTRCGIDRRAYARRGFGFDPRGGH